MPAPLTGRELQGLYMTDPATRPQVIINAQQYMATYGRYALGVAMRLLPSFRDKWDSQPIGKALSVDFSVNNYKRDINGSDWFDRALGYGNAGFRIEGRFEIINGEKRFVGTIKPLKDNYDFAPSNKGIFSIAARVVNGLLDPFGIGRKVDINFSGPGKAIEINKLEFDKLVQADKLAVREYNDITNKNDGLNAGEDAAEQGILDTVGDAVMLANLFTKNGLRFFSEFPEARSGSLVGISSLVSPVTARALFTLFGAFYSDPLAEWIKYYKSGDINDTRAQLINTSFGWFLQTVNATVGNYLNTIDSVAGYNTLEETAFKTAGYDLSKITATNLSFDNGGFTYADSVGLARIKVGQDAATGGLQVFYYDKAGKPTISLSQNPATQTTTLSHLADPNGSPFDYFIDTGSGDLTGFEQKNAGGEVVLHGYVTTIKNPDGTTSVVTTREGAKAQNNIKWSTEVVTRRTPTPGQIALGKQLTAERTGGANLGALFGSTLGAIIGGDNLFVRVAAGTVLSAVLSNIGDAIALGGETATKAVKAGLQVDKAFDSFGKDLGNTFRSQAIGAISSLWGMRAVNDNRPVERGRMAA